MDDKVYMSTILKLSDVRKSDQPQLWVSGCSFTDGDGVQPNQRYGQLLANQLNLPVSFLSQRGSSIIWAADQILRSDLRENDILVWGLTSVPRINYFQDNKVNHIFPSFDYFKNFQKFLVEHEEDILYKSLTSVYQVINFCKKIKVDLVLVDLLNHDLKYYLKDDVNVLSLMRLWGRDPNTTYEDYGGGDGKHPGVKTHAFYATEILKKIQERRK